WVSTWMVTSSGIRFSSTSWRTKSKSVCDAAGKPTSISLKPILTSVSDIRRFFVGALRADARRVAVAQIDRAPDRGLGDGLRRPLAVRQVYRGERSVLVERHAGHGLALTL